MSDWARCQSCDAEIRWGVTVDGIRMPLDVEPVESGAVFILANGRLRVLDTDERRRARDAGATLFMAHHATCPGAGRHRVPRSQMTLDVDGAA